MPDVNPNLESLRDTVQVLLSKKHPLTPDTIREVIAKVRKAPVFEVTDDEAERLAKQFEELHGVTMSIGALLVDEHRSWLSGALRDLDPYYWDRYRKYLVGQTWPIQVLASMDEITRKTLDLLENPVKPGPWDRRGMVIGHVQSGKTANYIGLICKAADAGYRLVVVIAGIHNNLRNQTQLRIDEGFVGFDSTKLLNTREQAVVGVGRLDSARRPVTFTTAQRDFNKRIASSLGLRLQDLRVPAIIVIKKNSSTLKHLLEWLKSNSTQGDGKKVDVPLLVIDDEADNASINIMHGKGEVSKINGQIRQLLSLFPRSSYVGYTATPFANIFIDPETSTEMLGEDLFPKHFIMSLDPPSNYFGADKVFGVEDQSPIRTISDHEASLPLTHKTDHQVTDLPSSLHNAIRAFVVARAIRIARGDATAHSSMLVNASRFNNVQRQLRHAIHHAVSQMGSSIRTHARRPSTIALRHPEIRALHDVWEAEYADTEFVWDDIQPLLPEAIGPVTVVEINSKSSSALNYRDHEATGLHVIAVGGYSLSRGLTLEGLMASYFLRNSEMYDTLMQMARWFGYRPGYEDLCRIWMPEEAEEWYTHIAESIEMLRDEVRAMERAGATPSDFGLKVRAHPDTLKITARNKIGAGEERVVSVSLAKQFIETAVLPRRPEDLEANRATARSLANSIWERGVSPESGTPVRGGRLFRDVPADDVLDFLRQFRNHPKSILTHGDVVAEYVEQRLPSELGLWDVLFAGVSDSHRALNPIDTSLGFEIVAQRRAKGERTDASSLYVSNKQRVASRGVEAVNLSDAQREAAEAGFRATLHGGPARVGSTSYPDRIYRPIPRHPLIVIHLLAIGHEGDDLRTEKPVVAWSISFPPTNLPQKGVRFTVNSVWRQTNLGITADDVEDEEMAGDDVVG